MATQLKERAKRDLLWSKMRELGIAAYEYGDRVIEIVNKGETVKVRNIKDDDED